MMNSRTYGSTLEFRGQGGLGDFSGQELYTGIQIENEPYLTIID
jgi:hypothetical protein